MNEEARMCAKEILSQQPFSFLITIDEEGYPAFRIMWTAKVEDDFTVYYVANRMSNKCRHMAADPRVAVFWTTGNSYFMLKGDAVVMDDQEMRDTLWRDSMTQYFPGGKTDPNFVVIRVSPKGLTCLD